MKAKFWFCYFIATLVILSGVYMGTADMSNAPLVLSDLQMELLSGTEMLMDWECIFMDPCQDMPCNNNNLLEVDGVTGCTGCEVAPNLNCYLKGDIITCVTCRVWQYPTSCDDAPKLVYTTSYKECE